MSTERPPHFQPPEASAVRAPESLPSSQPSATATPALNRQLEATTDEQALVLDLQQYPLRTRRTLTLLWLFTGIFGGHRYYLHQVGPGVLMTLTYGGAGIWWLLDGFRLGRMLEAYNGEQNFRRKRGLPPMELDFMPTLDTRLLERRPPWFLGASVARRRLGRDALVVGFVAAVLGSVCTDSDWRQIQLEPIAGLLALLALVQARPQLLALRRHRFVQEILQWHLKLKLYYHQNAVPPPFELLFRPLLGLFTVAFRRRRSGEARLYMELGVVFTVIFSLVDIARGTYWPQLASADFSGLLRAWLGNTVVQFFVMYSCLTPIGATLLKHELMLKPDRDRLVLTAATLGGLLFGLFVA